MLSDKAVRFSSLAIEHGPAPASIDREVARINPPPV
jgi:hypothetical protein